MAVNEVARVYAKALLEIGKENNLFERIKDELNLLRTLVEEDLDFRLFCETPNISAESKKAFVEKVFNNVLCTEMINFLKVLIDNNRLTEIKNIDEAFQQMVDEESGRMRVVVTGIDKLDAKIIERLKEVLSKKFNKEIIIEEKIDKSILGGIIIRIGDLIIDGSVLKDLNNIRKNLLLRNIRRELAYED